MMVHGPVPVIEPNEAAAQLGDGPTPTLTNPGFEALADCGAVQPAGITTIACEPTRKSLPLGAANTNVKLFPVLPGVTLVGETVMVPSPSLALAAAVYGPTNGPPLPTGSAPAGSTGSVPLSL